MTVQEAIKIVNGGNFHSLNDADEIFDENAVARGLDIEHRRWFDIETNVYRVDDGFVGVRGVTAIDSDMEYEDCSYLAHAFEYERSFTYKPKPSGKIINEQLKKLKRLIPQMEDSYLAQEEGSNIIDKIIKLIHEIPEQM